MKEIPLLMIGSSIRASLEDRKTVTRRLNGLHEINERPDDWVLLINYCEWKQASDYCGYCNLENCSKATLIIPFAFKNKKTGKIKSVKNPYGQPGDRLWCKETWCQQTDGDLARMQSIFYKATDTLINKLRWKSPRFMPKWACRLWLIRTDEVRLERVREITEEEAIKEGCKATGHLGVDSPDGPAEYNELSAKHDFAGLWDSLNAKRGYGWDKNPWVWRVPYRRVK